MISFLRVSLLTLAFATAATFGFAQGTLTPPGAPAPSMKSLDQIDASLSTLQSKAEARIPISPATTPGDATAQYIISQPGSYYLTGNITGEAGKNGIWINASNVTLDLNGYALITAVDTLTAVGCPSGLRQIAVKNGSIRGPWSVGLSYATNAQVSARDVTVQGTTQYGIQFNGFAATFESCQIMECGGGIFASSDHTVVRGCTITQITRNLPGTVYGIAGAVITDCVVNGVTNTAADGNAYGVLGRSITNTRVTSVNASNAWMINGSTVQNCSVNNGAVIAAGATFGIAAKEVSNCHVQQLFANSATTTIGIQSPLVIGCTVERVNNTGAGSVYAIRGGPTSTTTGATAETVTVSHCTVSGSSGWGIYVAGMSVVENNRVGYCTIAGMTISTGAVRGNFTHNCGTGYGISNGLVTGNTSFSDTIAFSYGASVRAGPTVVGAGVGAFDPNANFDL